MNSKWTEEDELLIKQSQHSTLYEKLGCHYENGEFVFRVYAPKAYKVSIVGNFNNWDENDLVLNKITENVFEGRSSNVNEGDIYKLRIFDSLERVIDRRDPFAFQTELRPNNSSVVKCIDKLVRKDKTPSSLNAINIYELHLNSFSKNKNYVDIAKEVANYIKKMNYTHVEIMPLMEYPSDESWGYQVLGYYSITSRYGNIEDFREMISVFHKNNIKVILDWVPVHFANDFDGLAKFDGTNLFEYNSEMDAINSQWGTRNFDLGSPFVKSFLLSNINFLINIYNIDAVRFDAVSYIIYWHGNEHSVNEMGLEFLKNINSTIKRLHPNFLLIAEDSSAYPGITKDVNLGGLGFDYKWCLGWMHDVLDFFSSDFLLRGDVFYRLTFSFVYMCNENYILAFSHDEVVHMKKTIVDKMFGNYEQKMQQAKMLYAHMFMHPGMKLNFMGNDIATFKEFHEQNVLDWEILKYPLHDSFNKYFRDLSSIFIESKFAINTNDSFYYLMDHAHDNVLVYARYEKHGHKIIILNCSPNYYKDYKIKVCGNYTYKLLIDSNWEKYGGYNKEYIQPIKPILEYEDNYINYSLQPLQAIILETEHKDYEINTLDNLKKITKKIEIKEVYNTLNIKDRGE